jgi:phosphatidate cytidylyltransferase
MSKELLKRILSSLVLIFILGIFIIQGGIIFNLFVLICFFLTVFEWHKMSKKKQLLYTWNFFFNFFLFFYLLSCKSNKR